MFENGLRFMSSTEEREKEWLKRVGNPARLAAIGGEGVALSVDALRTMRPGTDYTVMAYVDREGGSSGTAERHAFEEGREQVYRAVMEELKRGVIREYKRVICFDHDVLANDSSLKSGVLRVGEGPGTIQRNMGEHCGLMMETKGCSIYVAPVVLRSATVALYGADKVLLLIETVHQETGALTFGGGALWFHDPPNGEIIEQFRQIERATERRMVAVHKIIFPEDKPTSVLAAR